MSHSVKFLKSLLLLSQMLHAYFLIVQKEFANTCVRLMRRVKYLRGNQAS
jgi:hypothetical protein